MERDIVTAIRRSLVRRGVWVLKTHGSAMQATGIPDLLCCWRGRFVGLEVKQPGEEPTPLQSYTLEEIRAAGGIGEVVHSTQEALEAGSMCAIQPLYSFKVTEQRITAAQDSIRKRINANQITKEQMFEVLMELGWGDALGFEPRGPLEISNLTTTLTDMQWCAFAAAIAAAVEAGCELVGTA